MNITLTPELEKAVAEKVSSGGYADESQFICEVLRKTLSHEEERNAWLRAELQIGLDDIEAGRVIEIESKEHFMAMVRDGQ